MKVNSALKLTKRQQRRKRLRLQNTRNLFSILLVCLLPQFAAFSEELDIATKLATEAQTGDFNLAIKDNVDQTDQAILDSLTEAANRGSAAAALALGNRYFDGTGADKDIELALMWWTKSSELGSPSAAYNLGVAHLGDDGVVKDLKKAKAAFIKAADLGVVDAHLALGILRLHEAQSPQDYTLAGEHFRHAATAGSSVASHFLSVLYDKGLGYPKDLEKAAYWRDLVPPQGYSEPAVANKSSAKNPLEGTHIVHDSDWIVTRPAENYTLQLASGDTLKGTKKLISKITTLDCAVFRKIFAEKERFVAIAGDFLSYADALAAIEELPDKFLRNKPFIVNFKLLQRQIADHSTFNN